jgi:HTH-type transcriptional regulator/antitoxin HigA
MNIHPIRNERDHAKVLRQIEKLWGAGRDTPEADTLEVLVTLVDAYEAKHHLGISADVLIGPIRTSERRARVRGSRVALPRLQVRRGGVANRRARTSRPK